MWKKWLALLLWLLPLWALAEECPLARGVGEDYVCQVQNQTPVGDAWFEDAVLIGDSLAGSIGDYDVVPTLTVEAYIGISPEHAHKSRMLMHKGSYVTMVELAAACKPGKVLVMLGSNGLTYKDAPEVLEQYHGLVDALLTELPGVEIYLLSVTPVRPDVRKEKPGLNMDNIQEFNVGLYDLAETHGIHYIDICTPLMAEDGSGIDKALCTGDGLHLPRSGALAVTDAIRLQVDPEGEE